MISFLIPFLNESSKNIFKNFKQHFMRVIKLTSNLCAKYTELFKNFGRRDKETGVNGLFHGTLTSPS